MRTVYRYSLCYNRADAVKFFTLLHSKGFVYLGEEVDLAKIRNQYFSYDKVQPYELQASDKLETQKTYESTFGMDYRLTRLHVDISSRCNEIVSIAIYLLTRNGVL